MALLSVHPMAPDLRAACLRNFLIGSASWLLGLLALRLEWAAALLLLAPLVLVPLGLRLVANPLRPDRQQWPVRAVVWFQLVAALALLGSFTLDSGLVAGVLALPWLFFTFLVAFWGLTRLWSRGLVPAEELSIDAGLIYLAVGGLWTVLSRWGVQPLGFSTDIVRFTAVHFHYAGFVLPLLTGLAGRVRKDHLVRGAVIGIVVGVPLVAMGITFAKLEMAFARPLECLAACWLAAAGIVVAWLQLRFAVRVGPGIGRLLVLVSGFSLLIGMSLALVYALGMYLGTGWLDIPLMLRWHGTINALGFALPGLLAWNLSLGLVQAGGAIRASAAEAH